MYNWETSDNHIRKKKIKKTGTVVFHQDPSVEPSFDHLLKEVPLSRDAKKKRFQKNHPSEDSPANDDDEHACQFVSNALDGRAFAPLITPETVKILTSTKGPFQFSTLLPSQAQCYRGVFKGRDLILHSQTGSGKTLAYALPLVERYLILDELSPKNDADTTKEKPKKSKKKNNGDERAPFLLIFVFSNELAYQTKTVLDNLYAKRGLVTAVAGGQEDLTSLSRIDILIGTVPHMDTAIRGPNAPITPPSKGKYKKHKDSKKNKNSAGTGKRSRQEEEDESSSDDDDELNGSDDADDSTIMGPTAKTTVSAAKVRSVVVDEVDTTLGPRFSQIGRRMKMLLNTVRKSNGSLQPQNLIRDFRCHHYVLCGATIPNWVIKAGFLGIKKYYYQLVEVGKEKLPSNLECFLMESTYNKELKEAATRKAARIEGTNDSSKKNDDVVKATDSVCKSRLATPVASRIDQMCQIFEQRIKGTEGWGRVVIFGNTAQIDDLEVRLIAFKEKASLAAASPSKGKNKPVTPINGWGFVTGIRSISPSKGEAERIKNTTEFNSGAVNVMLCTDIASRGLDFVNVDVVFMLSLPRHGVMAAETFIHRAGRTARVHGSGKCIAFVDYQRDEDVLKRIETSTHVTFKRLNMTMINAPYLINNSDAEEITEDNGDSSVNKDNLSSSKGVTNTIKRSLTVRSPFAGGNLKITSASATPSPPTSSSLEENSAYKVLLKELKGQRDASVAGGGRDLMEALVLNVVAVNGDDGGVARGNANTSVVFETPVEYDHIVTKKLWKYTLKEIC